VRIPRFIDSHTEGEPTRALVAADGGPLDATLPEVLAAWSSGGALAIPAAMLALAANPRAADATVCALVCRPSRADTACGVLYWNASAPLGMCGHATIGLARTLVHAGVALPPRALLETRVGDVAVETLADGRVRFENVPARVHALDLEVTLEQGGVVRGDLAWGGNWFFIVRLDGAGGRAMRDPAEELAFARSIERGIRRMGLVAGAGNGGLIDHVALLFAPSRADAHARNLVLCPNGTYDRSPCGTGTSALLATLAARGELAEGAAWRQESAIGSLFEATYRAGGRTDEVVPSITGRAFVVADGRLVDDPSDPSRGGAWREPAGPGAQPPERTT
jgi:4-hydroxyproline epimerase